MGINGFEFAIDSSEHQILPMMLLIPYRAGFIRALFSVVSLLPLGSQSRQEATKAQANMFQ